MIKKLAIIGGDLRIVKLAEQLSEDDIQINMYGFDENKDVEKIENVTICNTLEEAINGIEVIIGPMPFTSNGININAIFSKKVITIQELIEKINGKVLIAGGIPPEVYEQVEHRYMEVIDLLKREELAVLNTIATAEGAIQIAIAETNRILHGSNVLVLGFGRIGKVLARKLAGIGAKVTCAARKEEDLAWIRAYGHNKLNIRTELDEANLFKFDIIINTVPHLILTREKIKLIDKECVLIDLASNPGGIDKIAAKENNIKLIWALSLPGKVAPVTSAEFMKETIYNILREIYK